MSAFRVNLELGVTGPIGLDPVLADMRRRLAGVRVDVAPRIGAGSQRQVDGLVDALRGATREGKAAGSALGELGRAVPANAARRMQGVGQAARQATVSIDLATGRASALGQAIGTTARRFGQFVLVARSAEVVGRAFSQGVSEAVAFQHELVRLSQISGTTRGDIADVSAEIGRLSRTLGTSSKDLSQIATTLRQADFAGKEVTATLEALAKTTLTPTFESIKNTTEGVVALKQQFGVSAKEIEGYLGSINTVSGALAVESEDLVTAIRKAGGAFKSASGDLNSSKQSFDQLLALFSAVRSTTRESADEISTGLRTIFGRLQSDKVSKSLADLGINLRYTAGEAQALGRVDLAGNFVGAYEAVRRLSAATRELSGTDPRFAKIAEEIGGYRQISRVIPLLQQFGTAERALAIAQAGSGSLTADATKAQASFQVQLDKTKESFFGLIRGLGDDQSVQQLGKLFLGGADAAIKLAEALKPLVPLIAAIGLRKAVGGLGGLGGLASLAGGARSSATNFGGDLRAARPALAAPARRRYQRGGVVPGSGRGDHVPMDLSAGDFVVRRDSALRAGPERIARYVRDGGSVPALLEPQEYLVPARDARRVGYINLERLNRTGELPTGRYASGGIVGRARRSLGAAGSAVGRSATARLYAETDASYMVGSGGMAALLLTEMGMKATPRAVRFVQDRLRARNKHADGGQFKIDDLVRAIVAGRTDANGVVAGIDTGRRANKGQLAGLRGNLTQEIARGLHDAGLFTPPSGRFTRQVGRSNITDRAAAVVAERYGLDLGGVERRAVGGRGAAATRAAGASVEDRATADPKSVEGRVVKYLRGLNPAEVLAGSGTGQEVFETANKQIQADLFDGRPTSQPIEVGKGKYRTIRGRVPGIVPETIRANPAGFNRQRHDDLRRYVRREIRNFTDQAQAILKESGAADGPRVLAAGGTNRGREAAVVTGDSFDAAADSRARNSKVRSAYDAATPDSHAVAGSDRGLDRSGVAGQTVGELRRIVVQARGRLGQRRADLKVARRGSEAEAEIRREIASLEGAIERDEGRLGDAFADRRDRVGVEDHLAGFGRMVAGNRVEGSAAAGTASRLRSRLGRALGADVAARAEPASPRPRTIAAAAGPPADPDLGRILGLIRGVASPAAPATAVAALPASSERAAASVVAGLKAVEKATEKVAANTKVEAATRADGTVHQVVSPARPERIEVVRATPPVVPPTALPPAPPSGAEPPDDRRGVKQGVGRPARQRELPFTASEPTLGLVRGSNILNEAILGRAGRPLPGQGALDFDLVRPTYAPGDVLPATPPTARRGDAAHSPDAILGQISRQSGFRPSRRRHPFSPGYFAAEEATLQDIEDRQVRAQEDHIAEARRQYDEEVRKDKLRDGLPARQAALLHEVSLGGAILGVPRRPTAEAKAIDSATSVEEKRRRDQEQAGRWAQKSLEIARHKFITSGGSYEQRDLFGGPSPDLAAAFAKPKAPSIRDLAYGPLEQARTAQALSAFAGFRSANPRSPLPPALADLAATTSAAGQLPLPIGLHFDPAFPNPLLDVQRVRQGDLSANRAAGTTPRPDRRQGVLFGTPGRRGRSPIPLHATLTPEQDRILGERVAALAARDAAPAPLGFGVTPATQSARQQADQFLRGAHARRDEARKRLDQAPFHTNPQNYQPGELENRRRLEAEFKVAEEVSRRASARVAELRTQARREALGPDFGRPVTGTYGPELPRRGLGASTARFADFSRRVAASPAQAGLERETLTKALADTFLQRKPTLDAADARKQAEAAVAKIAARSPEGRADFRTPLGRVLDAQSRRSGIPGASNARPDAARSAVADYYEGVLARTRPDLPGAVTGEHLDLATGQVARTTSNRRREEAERRANEAIARDARVTARPDGTVTRVSGPNAYRRAVAAYGSARDRLTTPLFDGESARLRAQTLSADRGQAEDAARRLADRQGQRRERRSARLGRVGLGVSVAGFYAPEALSRVYGTLENPTGTAESASAAHQAGGALQGAALGGTIGGIFGPLGTAAGTLAGAFLGLRTAAREASERLASVQYERRAAGYQSVLGNVATGNFTPGPEHLATIHRGIADARSEALRRAIAAGDGDEGFSFGFESNAAEKLNKSDEVRRAKLREVLGPDSANLQQTLSHLAGRVKLPDASLAADESLDPGSLRKRRSAFDTALDKAGAAPIIQALQRSGDGRTEEQIRRALDPLILSAQRQRAATLKFSEALEAAESRLARLGEVAEGLAAGESGAGTLRRTADALSGLGPVRSGAGSAEIRLGGADRTGLDQARGLVAGAVGPDAARNLLGHADDVDRAMRDLPRLLYEKASGSSDPAAVRESIQSILPQLPESVRPGVSATLAGKQEGDLLEQGRLAPNALAKELLGPLADEVRGALKDIVATIREAEEDFADRLRASSEAAREFGDALDRRSEGEEGVRHASYRLRSIRTGIGADQFSTVDDALRTRRATVDRLAGPGATADLIGGRLRGVRQDIATNQDKLDHATGKDERAGLIRDGEELRRKATDLAKALGLLGDATAEQAAIAEKLNALDRERAGHLGLTERYVTGSAADRRELRRGDQAAGAASRRGTLAGLSPQNQKRALDFLGQAGEIRFPAFQNRSGSEIRDQLLADANKRLGGGLGRVDRERQALGRRDVGAAEGAQRARGVEADLAGERADQLKAAPESIRQKAGEGAAAALRAADRERLRKDRDQAEGRLNAAGDSLRTATGLQGEFGAGLPALRTALAGGDLGIVREKGEEAARITAASGPGGIRGELLKQGGAASPSLYGKALPLRGRGEEEGDFANRARDHFKGILPDLARSTGLSEDVLQKEVTNHFVATAGSDLGFAVTGKSPAAYLNDKIQGAQNKAANEAQAEANAARSRIGQQLYGNAAPNAAQSAAINKLASDPDGARRRLSRVEGLDSPEAAQRRLDEAQRDYRNRNLALLKVPGDAAPTALAGQPAQGIPVGVPGLVAPPPEPVAAPTPPPAPGRRPSLRDQRGGRRVDELTGEVPANPVAAGPSRDRLRVVVPPGVGKPVSPRAGVARRGHGTPAATAFARMDGFDFSPFRGRPAADAFAAMDLGVDPRALGSKKGNPAAFFAAMDGNEVAPIPGAAAKRRARSRNKPANGLRSIEPPAPNNGPAAGAVRPGQTNNRNAGADPAKALAGFAEPAEKLVGAFAGFAEPARSLAAGLTDFKNPALELAKALGAFKMPDQIVLKASVDVKFEINGTQALKQAVGEAVAREVASQIAAQGPALVERVLKNQPVRS